MNSQKLKNLASVVAAILVALAVLVLTKVFFQNTTARVLVKGHFPHDTLVTVSSVSTNGRTAALDSFEIKGSDSPKPQYHGTRTMNLPIKSVQLDFTLQDPAVAHEESQISLTQIQLRKPYQKDYYFSGDSLSANFSSAQALDGKTNTYKFAQDGTSIAVTSNTAIGEQNWALIIGMPLLFFVGVLFIARNSIWAELPAFADMSLGNKISSSGEFDTINGLRGLAALLVLLSHTAPGFEAVQMGLAFLFVISGFLLSKPFVLDSKKIFSRANLERYVTKRLKRILPMYYLYVFLIYVITFKFDIALRHFFFVQAEGHLWPMTQIFAFYMLLPFVLMITSASYRIHKLVPLVLLSIAIYCCVIYMRGWMPFYNGLYSHEFFLYAFLMGVAASYIQYDLFANKGSSVWGNRGVREIVSVIALLVTFYIIAWSAPMKPSAAIFQWVSQFWVKCLASVAIILLALNTPKTVYRLLISNWLFRSVGVVGFSFYILHGLGMQIFAQIQAQYLGDLTPGQRGWDFMLGAFVVSYIMALITYSFVERPFFGYREKR